MATGKPIAGAEQGIQQALLGGLFDYAGMFPPASLPFDEALRTAASFARSLARPWLVGAEAVLDEDLLPELTAERLARCGFSPGLQLRVAVLGGALEKCRLISDGPSWPGSGAPDAFRWHGSSVPEPSPWPPSGTPQPSSATPGPEGHALQAGGSLPEGRAHPGPGVRLVSYEVKMAGVGEEEIAALARLTEAAGLRGMRVYAELEWTPADWLSGCERAVDALEALHARRGQGPGIGLKVRGSGRTAIDRPALARVIAAVNARNLPFKATAGLHHPLVEPERYGNSLGFLGLAAALRLQKVLGPGEFPLSAVEACLAETDAGAFGFEDGLSWREFRAGGLSLAQAIRSVPFSIGSCSLHEPDEDLSRLFGP